VGDHVGGGGRRTVYPAGPPDAADVGVKGRTDCVEEGDLRRQREEATLLIDGGVGILSWPSVRTVSNSAQG